jgi:hypothetical protein
MHYSFFLNLFKNFFIVPYTALHVSGTLVPIIRSLLQHSKNTQPEQRHTVPEAANAVQK